MTNLNRVLLIYQQLYLLMSNSSIPADIKEPLSISYDKIKEVLLLCCSQFGVSFKSK